MFLRFPAAIPAKVVPMGSASRGIVGDVEH